MPLTLVISPGCGEPAGKGEIAGDRTRVGAGLRAFQRNIATISTQGYRGIGIRENLTGRDR
jgi:hypothetical protein